MWGWKKNFILTICYCHPPKQLILSHIWATYYNLWHLLFRLFQDLLKKSCSTYDLSLSSDQWGLSRSHSLLKTDSLQIFEMILQQLSEHLHVYFLCLGSRLIQNLTWSVFLMLQWCHDCYLSVISTRWIMLEFQTGCGGQSIDKAMNQYMALLSWHSLVVFITRTCIKEETAAVARSSLLVLGLSLFSWWVWMALIVSLLTDVTIIWLPV